MPGSQASSAPRQLAVESADGTEIGVWVSGAGPALVLVHGTSADHSRWKPVLSALEARFSVMAVDRRGRGGSGDTLSYAFEREFEDIAAVVDRAADATGGPVYLLGHSWGGVCSIGGALRTPNVAKLALYEPPLVPDESVYPPDFLAEMDRLVGAGKNDEAVTTFMREVVRVPPAQLELLRSLPAWQGRVAAAHTVARECRRKGYPIAPSQLSALRMPVLILEGQQSPAFLRDAVQLLHKRIPQSTVATMPGQQHAAMDTGPDLFLKPVLDFLA